MKLSIKILLFLISYLLSTVALGVKFEELTFDLTINDLKYNKYFLQCFIEKENELFGTISFSNSESNTNMYELITAFEEKFQGSNLSAVIHKKCVDMVQKHFAQRNTKMGIFSVVHFLNYPSLVKNIKGGMRLFGISSSGSWLFIDDKKSIELLDEKTKNKYITNIPQKDAKNIFEDIKNSYEDSSDQLLSGYTTSKKFLAEKKEIKNAQEYYNMLVKIAKENGVEFGSIDF